MADRPLCDASGGEWVDVADLEVGGEYEHEHEHAYEHESAYDHVNVNVNDYVDVGAALLWVRDLAGCRFRPRVRVAG